MAVVSIDVSAIASRWGGWRYPLAVGVLSRLLTLVVVAVVGLLRREPGQGIGSAMVAPFGGWDGIWYQRIALYGYDPTVAHGNGVAFSPLFPELLRLTRDALSVSLVVGGVLASTTCFLLALILLHRLVSSISGPTVARRIVWLVAFFPTAFLFSAVYTESLYLLLTVVTFVLLERRWLVAACTAGTLAVLTRPTGIMLVPSLILRTWKDGGRRLGLPFVLRVIVIAVLPAVYIAFGAYLYFRTGDPFATQSAQSAGWGRGANLLLVLGLPVAVLNGAFVATHEVERISYIFDTAFAMTWALLLIEGAWRRRLPGEYLLYGALAVILPVFAGTYLALPRYGMGIFVVMWLAAIHVASRPRLMRFLYVAMPVSLVVTAIVVYGFGGYVP